MAESFMVDPGAKALLVDLDIEPANVLRRASLQGDLFAQESISLTPPEYFGFWSALEEEAADPNLPITIGRAISAEVFSPPIFAALCSPNLEVAAGRIATYKPLIGPMTLGVDSSAEGLTISYQWPDQVNPPAMLALTELVFWVALARIGTRDEITPVRIVAPDPPADDAAYEDYLGVTIEKGAEQSITFSTEDAQRPFLTTNHAMWDFFEPELRRRLAELETDSSVTERARATLLELLPAGRPTMQALAGELAVSTRTLQRRLQAEHTSFQEVLSATRSELAHHYLTNGDLTAGEISFLLGYEDPNSFYRAFHTWTGRTPDQVRALAN